MIAQNVISTKEIVITAADFDRLRASWIPRATALRSAASAGAAGRAGSRHRSSPPMRCPRAW